MDLQYKDVAPEFPSELKKLNRWVVRDADKRPYSPYPEDDGNPTSDAQIEANQSDYDTALGAIEENKRYAGLGFVFNYKDGLTGVDFDDCVENGKIRQDVLDIVAKLDTYCEFSPSGKGIHAFVTGWQFPVGSEGQQGAKVGKAEIYSGKRYFTVSGNRVPGTPATTNPRNLDWLYERIVKNREFARSASQSAAPSATKAEIVATSMIITDKFELLMRGKIISNKPFTLSDGLGNTLEYVSQSEADLALATFLAVRDMNPLIIDESFRKSSLYRPKWEREDYRTKTINKAIQASKQKPVDVSIEIEEIEEEEPLPDFPQLTGSLRELVDALFPDIPYDFKMMSAVTHWGILRSGKDALQSDPSCQPRFYTCFIKEAGWGKTAAMNELERYMSMIGNYNMTASVDSGPALIDEFADIGKNFPIGDLPSRLLLKSDEMSSLFEKAKISLTSRNSLSTELLTLYESNQTGNRSRKSGKTAVKNAHLAIIGGTTPDVYKTMWTGTSGGSGGLQSRFVPVTTNLPRMPVNRRESDMKAVSDALARLRTQNERSGQTITLTDDSKSMLVSWWGSGRSKPSEIRVDDMVKRLLIVLAVTNDVSTIGVDLMSQGIQFGDYVIAVRDRFNPDDSYSWTQSFEQMIEKVARKKNIGMTLNDYRRLVQPGRKPGGLGPFLQAWKNCVATGLLKEDGRTIQGTLKYRI